MAIIWCGGEEIDFPDYTSPPTNTAYYRAAYARTALRPASNGYIGPGDILPATPWWLSFRAPFGANVYADTFFRLVRSDHSLRGFYLTHSGAATNIVSLSRHDGTATTFLADTGAVQVTEGASNIRKWDIYVDPVQAGVFRLYADGVLILEYLGDMRCPGSLGPPTRPRWLQGYAGWDSISEVILADEDTRLFSVKTLAPNAAGDINTFTAGSYADIDETAFSDADTAYSSTPEQDLQVNLTGMPAGNFIVKAVKSVQRIADGVGGMGMQIGIKANGVLDLSETIPLAAAWENHERIWHTNPGTNNRFTPEDVEALQLAFRSKAV
jgi:hypothetical protein